MPVRSTPSAESDTYSLLSQATTTMTIGDSLPAQLVRKSARKGFTFNIMSVGPPGLGKTVLLSALFGKNLDLTSAQETAKISKDSAADDPMNPPIKIESKTFEMDEKNVRLKLTVVGSKSYGEALSWKNTHAPLVEYIEAQFADYHKRESGFDRKNVKDKMVHCLFFFISAIGPGLSKLDIDFLKAVDGRVNIVPIIAKAEALTEPEKASLKRRVKDDLDRNQIKVYLMPDAEADDSDDIKRGIKEIQDAMPFAISSISRKSLDNSITERILDWCTIDLYDRDHSDFLLLKTMLHMQMPDLCDVTHEMFYEQYRLRRMQESQTPIKTKQQLVR